MCWKPGRLCEGEQCLPGNDEFKCEFFAANKNKNLSKLKSPSSKVQLSESNLSEVWISEEEKIFEWNNADRKGLHVVRLNQMWHSISLTCPNVCVCVCRSGVRIPLSTAHSSESKVRVSTRNLKTKLLYIYAKCIFLRFHFHFRQGGVEKTVGGCSASWPSGGEPIFCTARGSNPVSEGRRALLHCIHSKAGGWGEQDLEPRGADAHEARDWRRRCY